ncbi:hypothetical protein ACFCW6_11690 [Streptomyces sp. NPDC056333]|uniref:hypothetical protein n=1 Tax=Streptomyces sp. NPDC056333 TaxID=3345786 RepID=UPI0035D7ACA1
MTCASPVFKRTFYANTTFSRTPKGWWDSTQPAGTTVFYRVTVRYEDGRESGASQTTAATD